MLNCRFVINVGSDFDSFNFAPFRLPYSRALFAFLTFYILLFVEFVILHCRSINSLLVPLYFLNSLASLRALHICLSYLIVIKLFVNIAILFIFGMIFWYFWTVVDKIFTHFLPQCQCASNSLLVG